MADVEVVREWTGALGGRRLVLHVDGERYHVAVDAERAYLHVGRGALDVAHGPCPRGTDPVVVAVDLIRAAQPGRIT